MTRNVYAVPMHDAGLSRALAMRLGPWKLLIPSILLLLVIGSTTAAEPSAGDLITGLDPEDQQWLGELMEVLDDSTEIATKSRLNADYVPGTVTVLQGRDLESLGMRTVWDALSLIPGVIINQGRREEYFVGVRGFNPPFNSGNIKVLLNSTPMSRDESGLSSQALSIPIEQVDRIEFIRGPGAVLYGDFAYHGVLNILTRQDRSRLSTRVDEHGTTLTNGAYAYQSQDKATRFGLNVAGATGHWVEAPEDRDIDNEQQSAIAQFRHRGFGLTAQLINEDYDDEQGLSREQRTETIALNQSLDLTDDTQFNLYASYLNNDYSEAGSRFLGQVWEGRAELTGHGIPRHRWLMQFSYTDSFTEEAVLARPPQVRTPGFSQSDISRRYFGFSLQDEFEATEQLTLTAGVRLDRRLDLDRTLFNPRLAAVWRISPTDILKAQYASGYRAPTFWELFPPLDYANTGLAPETIRASELSYIHRQADQVLRLTLFYSQFDDFIRRIVGRSNRPVFHNTGKALATGGELEWERQWSPRLKSWFNLSYADTRYFDDLSSTEPDPTTADWLGNLALFYRFGDQTLFTLYWNYVGKRHSDDIDTHAEQRVGVTLNWFNVGIPGLTLRLGVRNLLRANQRYLVDEAPPVGLTSVEFPDSLVWGQISYDF
ncbi:MAG: TonB-dependent receptor [Gammaproteobacteria bacterium]|nr:TonB-dependent receptor [Gammaproteobacteria bacterium]MCP5424030.1 TonB-dependent receptor [Gammaproteobacteria bacterium]MCP5459536.1 TonB-dependent receptor [Gammaproteobacteria bacterium]